MVFCEFSLHFAISILQIAMPPHLPVPKLRNLAAQVVVNDLVDFISLDSESYEFENFVEMDMQIKELYLSSIPAHICEDILQIILHSADLIALERFHALQFLLCHSFKCLEIGSFPDPYHSQVLSVIAAQGTGLTTLDLRGTWLKEENADNLSDTLEQLPHLSVLRIPHMANDYILETIGQCNSQLRILDVSGESRITRQGVAALCTGNNSALELVNVGRPGDLPTLEPSDVALLICHLPRLSSLGCYALVGQALACVSELVDGDIGLRYVHDTGTGVETMLRIMRRCPRLTSVYLDHPEDGVVSLLGDLATLREVKLARFNCDDLKALLGKCGKKIVTLNLVIGRGVLDVSMIAEQCTALRDLQFYKVEHLVHFQEIPFLCLGKLDIFYSTLSTTCLRYFVSCSPRLENLCLYDNILNLSDSIISELFVKDSYETIRVVRISNAVRLSEASVGTILSKCPNLTGLGYLETWRLSSGEIEELQLLMKISNLDLKIEL